MYTEYTKHLEHLPNIKLHPYLLPSEHPQFIGPWTLQGVESVPQGCWPMLTSMLHTVVSSWLDVLWVVDYSWYTRETVECLKTHQCCSSWHKPVHLAPTTIPRSWSLKSFVLPFTLWMAHIHNLCLKCLKAYKSVSFTSSKMFEMDLTSDINKGS